MIELYFIIGIGFWFGYIETKDSDAPWKLWTIINVIAWPLSFGYLIGLRLAKHEDEEPVP